MATVNKTKILDILINELGMPEDEISNFVNTIWGSEEEKSVDELRSVTADLLQDTFLEQKRVN